MTKRILALTLAMMSAGAMIAADYPTAVPTFYQQEAWDSTGTLKTDYALTVPESSPYTVQLRYQPKDSTFTVCTGTGGSGTCLTEDDDDPTPDSGEFYVDFDSGIIYFNAAQAGISYYATFYSYGSVALASEQNDIRDNLTAMADAMINGYKHPLAIDYVLQSGSKLFDLSGVSGHAESNWLIYLGNLYGREAGLRGDLQLTVGDVMPFFNGTWSDLGSSDWWWAFCYLRFINTKKIIATSEGVGDRPLELRNAEDQDVFRFVDDGTMVQTYRGNNVDDEAIHVGGIDSEGQQIDAFKVLADGRVVAQSIITMYDYVLTKSTATPTATEIPTSTATSTATVTQTPTMTSTAVPTATPTQRPGYIISVRQGNVVGTPVAGNLYIHVETGVGHVLAMLNDFTVVGWGDNTYGEVTCPSGEFVQVSAGKDFSIGLRPSGALEGWGRNNLVQIAVPGGTDYVAISCGENHTLALKQDGTVVGWGSNAAGQTTCPAGTFTRISAGGLWSLALKSDGSLAAWGSDTYNQITDLPTDAGYVAVAAGSFHGLALKSDGSIVGWGNNAAGQLSEIPAGNNFLNISAGLHPNCALRSDGTLGYWGAGAVPPVGNFFIQGSARDYSCYAIVSSDVTATPTMTPTQAGTSTPTMTPTMTPTRFGSNDVYAGKVNVGPTPTTTPRIVLDGGTGKISTNGTVEITGNKTGETFSALDFSAISGYGSDDYIVKGPTIAGMVVGWDYGGMLRGGSVVTLLDGWFDIGEAARRFHNVYGVHYYGEDLILSKPQAGSTVLSVIDDSDQTTLTIAEEGGIVLNSIAGISGDMFSVSLNGDLCFYLNSNMDTYVEHTLHATLGSFEPEVDSDKGWVVKNTDGTQVASCDENGRADVVGLMVWNDVGWGISAEDTDVSIDGTVVRAFTLADNVHADLPTASGNEGRMLVVKAIQGGLSKTLTLDGYESETIDGAATLDIPEGKCAWLMAYDGNWIVLSGE